MSYFRIIPRDFFNEAKLLKCMGVLQLKIHDRETPNGINIYIEETGEPFDIDQDGQLGLFFIGNYPVSINNEEYTVGTLVNSKENFPLVVYDNYEEIRIFDDNGEFTEEFIEHFTS